jgi:hypothetical protein
MRQYGEYVQKFSGYQLESSNFDVVTAGTISRFQRKKVPFSQIHCAKDLIALVNMLRLKLRLITTANFMKLELLKGYLLKSTQVFWKDLNENSLNLISKQILKIESHGFLIFFPAHLLLRWV